MLLFTNVTLLFLLDHSVCVACGRMKIEHGLGWFSFPLRTVRHLHARNVDDRFVNDVLNFHRAPLSIDPPHKNTVSDGKFGFNLWIAPLRERCPLLRRQPHGMGIFPRALLTDPLPMSNTIDTSLTSRKEVPTASTAFSACRMIFTAAVHVQVFPATVKCFLIQVRFAKSTDGGIFPLFFN